MPYLVHLSRKASAVEVADALEAAFVHLATEVLAPLDPLEAKPSFDALRAQLDRRLITLSKWKDANGLLETAGGDWDRGEIQTNLRQIEIIILALRSHALDAATDVIVNPTQQAGFDATGTLADGPWVLEAFGGANVSNNDKLGLDAKSLASAPQGTARFFACRPSAWPWAGRSRVGEYGSFECVHADRDRERVLVFELTPRPGRPSGSGTGTASGSSPDPRRASVPPPPRGVRAGADPPTPRSPPTKPAESGQVART